MKFKCEICGKTHDTITERAACETACAKKMEAENAAKQEAINRKRKEELRKQISDSIQVTEHLVEDYEHEFGTVPNLSKTFRDFPVATPITIASHDTAPDTLLSPTFPSLFRWLFG